MTRRSRTPVALVALLVMAGALVGLLGAHAHAFGEIDRVAHSLIEIDHPAVPAAVPHLDRALELEHPVCGDCLLASLKSDGALAPAATEAPSLSGLRFASLESTGARQPKVRRAPARAPPPA